MKTARAILILSFIGILNGVTAQDLRVQNPVKNFDKLWKVFNDRYANFSLKGVDWQKVYEKYRPLINENTDNDSLFAVCSKMVNELKDGHVNLIQYQKGKTILRKNKAPYPTRLLEKFPNSRKAEPNIHQLIHTTDSTLKANGFSAFAKSGNNVLVYSCSTDYGYLGIQKMHGLSMRKVRKFLDQAMDAFADKKGVILDIRFNGGGDDKLAYEIAGRFADKKRVGHYKQERKKGTNVFHKQQTWYLEPTGEKQFTKPIVVLTSDLAASAADVFAMAIKELPNATLLGDHTEGIFSDMYGFKLPNGWVATLSHQQYFSAAKVNYEGKGIPPDVVLLNQPEDVIKGVDPVIEKALELLKE